jgi:hypothetical protein
VIEPTSSEDELTGNSNRNLAPPSADALSVRMRRSCASMIDWAIGKPKPMPVFLVVKKPSNRRCKCSASMPGPLSPMMQHTVPASLRCVRMAMLRLAASDLAKGSLKRRQLRVDSSAPAGQHANSCPPWEQSRTAQKEQLATIYCGLSFLGACYVASILDNHGFYRGIDHRCLGGVALLDDIGAH